MKRKFGQNFLINTKIIEQIISLSNINNNSIVYEVGAGMGALTKEIIKINPKKYLAVEIDPDLKEYLNKYFNNNNHILKFTDSLKFNELNFFSNDATIISNLPYNISLKLLVKWIYQFSQKKWFSSMILMFQKEVGERIVARENSKKYGRISILTSAFFSTSKVLEIDKKNFMPVPKVDSVLIKFDKLSKPFLTNDDLPKLEKLTKIFFSTRRKKLEKKIKLIFSNELIEKYNLNQYYSLRAESLSRDTFYFLTKIQ